MNKKDKEDFDELFRQMGLCLFASQRIEFVLQIITILCAGLFTDKQVNAITIKSFLDNTGEGKKIRKKTLGALTKLTKELGIVDSDRLDSFVASRNYIIHDIWQKELNESIENRDVGACIFKCNNFITEADKIENGFKGLVYKIYTDLRQKVNLQKIESVEGWTIFEKHFDDFDKKNEA